MITATRFSLLFYFGAGGGEAWKGITLRALQENVIRSKKRKRKQLMGKQHMLQ